MGRRPWEDRGKIIRRLRLALAPEDWASLEAKARKAYWPHSVTKVIERELHNWADSERKRSSTTAATGPFALEQSGPVAPGVSSPDPVKESWRDWHTKA